MTDMTNRKASVKASSKERLLSAVADILYYIRHPHESDCPACAAFDELQSAALEIIREIENIEATIIEASDDVDSWSARRCKSDIR